MPDFKISTRGKITKQQQYQNAHFLAEEQTSIVVTKQCLITIYITSAAFPFFLPSSKIPDKRVDISHKNQQRTLGQQLIIVQLYLLQKSLHQLSLFLSDH
jgi:hypothetical protein